MSGFDHRCPFCDAEIDAHKIWIDNDYATSFRADCSKCGRSVQVDVHTVPEFETSRPLCEMCNRAEPGSNPHYCEQCHTRLTAARVF